MNPKFHSFITYNSNFKTMANTFTQCYVHLVFSPKNREALILNDWKDDLEKYITHITNSRKHRLLSINAPRDHIHILIGYYLSDSIPNLVEDLKSSSTKWINNNGLDLQFRFQLISQVVKSFYRESNKKSTAMCFIPLFYC